MWGRGNRVPFSFRKNLKQNNLKLTTGAGSANNSGGGAGNVCPRFISSNESYKTEDLYKIFHKYIELNKFKTRLMLLHKKSRRMSPGKSKVNGDIMIDYFHSSSLLF